MAKKTDRIRAHAEEAKVRFEESKLELDLGLEPRITEIEEGFDPEGEHPSPSELTRAAARRVGWALKTSLRERGITQVEAGEKLGVRSVTVSEWCRGVSLPPLWRFPHIDRLLGERRGYLLGRADYIALPTPEEAIDVDGTIDDEGRAIVLGVLAEQRARFTAKVNDAIREVELARIELSRHQDEWQAAVQHHNANPSQEVWDLMEDHKALIEEAGERVKRAEARTKKMLIEARDATRRRIGWRPSVGSDEAKGADKSKANLLERVSDQREVPSHLEPAGLELVAVEASKAAAKAIETQFGEVTAAAAAVIEAQFAEALAPLREHTDALRELTDAIRLPLSAPREAAKVMRTLVSESDDQKVSIAVDGDHYVIYSGDGEGDFETADLNEDAANLMQALLDGIRDKEKEPSEAQLRDLAERIPPEGWAQLRAAAQQFDQLAAVVERLDEDDRADESTPKG